MVKITKETLHDIGIKLFRARAKTSKIALLRQSLQKMIIIHKYNTRSEKKKVFEKDDAPKPGKNPLHGKDNTFYAQQGALNTCFLESSPSFSFK